MIRSNFHTHTTFCDGKNTPEEMVLTAIEKGFLSLGFSAHSYFFKDKQFTLSLENEIDYVNEINRLREKYKQQIKIFCGIEQDYFSSLYKGYDYTIGSVHNIYKNGLYLPIDASPENFNNILNEHFGGEYDAFAEHYFDTVADVINKTNANIIGHFDLVSKYSEKFGFSQSERYLTAAEKAVKALVKHKKPFEINTGAIARGHRTSPYPSPEILKMIKENGGTIIISSDCHNMLYLDCYFDEAEKLAKKFGFKQRAIITQNGLEYIDI